MTDTERALLLKLAEHLADLLEADAESIEQVSGDADDIRDLVEKIEAEAMRG